MSVGEDILLALGYILGWLPWIALFLSQWKRSLIPHQWFDQLFGETQSPPGLRGKLKYLVIIGALALWMNFVLWITLIPTVPLFEWMSFPKYCVVPRTFRGLLHVHQYLWHHNDLMHYASNNVAVWSLGPLVLSYNRRTFFSSLLFTGIVGGFLLWLLGPSDTCTVGFSIVIYGWFGVVLAGLFLECPPKWWRLVLIALFGIVLGATFISEVFSGDDEEGVSWHGHAFGFFSGLLYGYFRFLRLWFLCEGLEDRVRPLSAGGDSAVPISCCEAITQLIKAVGHSIWDGMVDMLACCACKSPQQTVGKTHSGSSGCASGSTTGTGAAGVGTGASKPASAGGPAAQPYGASGGCDAFGHAVPPAYTPREAGEQRDDMRV